MISIKKDITLTISNKDVKTLSDVCELAKREVREVLATEDPAKNLGFNQEEYQAIIRFIDKICKETI